ncbi:MAG: DUF1223 domain-containing protein [Arenimonas sp.]
MKNLIVIAGMALVSNLASAAVPMSCQAQSGKFVTPVVELYTSEGCSSCPPADVWLAQQARRTDINANFLAFHVDYWDDIGWPDRFANHAYTLRQYGRVQRKGSSQVYTPQVMVGEQTGVSWSWPDRSESFIKQANSALAIASIGLQANGTAGLWKAKVALSSLNALPNTQWYLAVYQDGLSSQVRAGENKGKLLKHDRVVRQWLGPYRLNGTNTQKDFDIALSNADAMGQTGLLAVLENSANGQVLQSLKLPLSQCKVVASK